MATPTTSASPALPQPYCFNDSGVISSPPRSDAVPFPASSISPAELARLVEQSNQGFACAGSRWPLILDLRPHPDFYPVSIQHSININLPTLLMRRYRRGGAISSFALESFITMPADKDVYEQIQGSWRADDLSSSEPHDVVVLDQEMKAGDEAYGRSATAAWTLLNVLERGGANNCFGEVPIRLWYLEGGFDAFQAWDASEKYLVRPESSMFPSRPNLNYENSQDVEMSLAAPATKPSLSIDTSVSFAPKKPQARRESLFSLNTKSLQRPASALQPLVIPNANNTLTDDQHQQQQCSKGGWLTVPTTIPSCAPSPTMSMVSNHSMEMSHSASTEHSADWSAGSSAINGSGHFSQSIPGFNLTLNTKRSVPSLATLNLTGIREDNQEQSQAEGLSSSLSMPRGRCIEQDDEDLDNGEQEISCILPNFLYLGPEILHQSQVDELDRLGVKRVLNMATECEDQLVANREGMEYHKIGVYDHIDADVSAGLMQAVDIIASSADAPIYVHCKAGKSRSVTATIAYLITQLHWPLNKAYQHVLARRPCMCPNIGFVTELMRIEERTLGADKATGLYGK
ncbi:hypothetical protein BCR41DRAFT_375926 [Lobosporangium transversale]|uniref:protein-tyrosine-phosphatase n=1 Tax=Lobosporangium transversale TaxID=64571 RepID=A0A1Y2G5E3_9FUNG|nr:hypothetical protein BCR41DRAFT_375926 [Lobosporangium transversale]ORY95100.1 hypothetical protein BCR41DRAFT_375926 [Lobosporangium transversale]|eukprot:XP_021875309.1 hypothetical protein BCR41DRAFT_375926 [Lobosporangium transversale]